MKKKLTATVTAAALILTVAVSATGCGKKATPENLLTDLNKNIKKVESVSGNMKMTASMGDDTGSAGMSMDVDMESTRKPAATHMDGEFSIKYNGSDINTTIEAYALIEDDEVVTYTNTNEAWSKSTSDDVEDALDINAFENLTKTHESFKKKEDLVKVNDKECFELTGKIGGKYLEGIMDEDMVNSFGSSGDILDEEKMEKAKIPCTIDIYKDSILPAKIHIDLKDLVQKSYADSYQNLEVEDYFVEITYFEYDNIKEIKVPKEALEATKGSDTDKDDQDDDKSAKSKKATPAKQSSELKDNWDSYTVQINDKVLTLPCEIKDLEAAGLALDTEDTAEDYVVNAGEYEFVFFKNDSGASVMIDMINQTDSPCKITECMVGGITVNEYDLEDGTLSVIFPGGIQIGGAKADVLSKYGETQDVYSDENFQMYTWKDADPEKYYNSCMIEFDAPTETIYEMQMQCYE